MNKKQKQIIIHTLERAFVCEPSETSDGRQCLLTDEQIEMLFGAISLAISFGPYQMTDEK